MATTEERLAALEAKLAQLTTTTPTTYYTHQYSGEEIDAAVGRAVSGGALDTSVTNVSNQLGTFVRPNLLDNWYFGRPVDQRRGKIIQQGVNIYTDSALTTLIGPAAYACPVVELTSTYAKVQDAKNTSSYYYAAPADVVRGYTGNRYGVDRWKSEANGITTEIISGGITISTTAESGATEVREYFEDVIPAGTMLTISAIISKTAASKNGVVRVTYVNGQVGLQKSLPDRAMDYELVTLSQAATFDVKGFVFRVSNGEGYTVHAAKLELGPTQTLAHQDADGNWVLNEVPKVGDELRECQGYHFNSKSAQNSAFLMRATSSSYLFGTCTFPVTMRTTPSVQLLSYRDPTTGTVITAGGVVSQITSDGFCVVYDAEKFTEGSVYQVAFSASADL